MPKYLLVGCGKMGGAMLEGWLKQGIPASDIKVIEPARSQGHVHDISAKVEVVDTLAQIPASFVPDIVIFAVKPQVMAEVVPGYTKFEKAVFLSIAAGKTIAFFEKALGKGRAVIRSMPNLPAIVGLGAMVAYPNAHVSALQKAAVEKLLAANGKVFWIKDESLLDAVTAISGSGPAYLFHFIECLEQAGKKLGLPDELASALAYLTIQGSTELAVQSDKSASELRVQVTSPKGTTQAALDVLMPELQPLLERATDAACKRSKELAD
jgi:pyrroline-5-carboxylate reductase